MGDEIGKEFYARTQAADRTVVENLCAIADGRGLPPARVALAWLLHKQAVTAPVVGATKPQQLEDAIAALDVTLSAEEIAALEAPYIAHEISGHN
jgi:aryl-alcohol dehydrogenase-like predicted oxidoreductase